VVFIPYFIGTCAEKEAGKINMLNLATIPNTEFDPQKVTYNVLE